MPPRKKAAPKSDESRSDEAQALSPADLMAAINKTFGADAVTMASHPDLEVTRWKTGVVPIDVLLDGGIPRGRFIEVFGPYSTLKSYWLYRSLASVQQQGGRVGLVDTEHSFDPEWATRLGVDCSNLMLSRPDTAEQGIGVLESWIRQRYDLVGFDSIAAAIPKQHREAIPGEDNQPGALARVMSKGLARLNTANKHTSVIFINQTREKIGITFGSNETTSGGKAMGFYASYRMSFRRTGKITEPYKAWDGKEWKDAKRVVAHTISCTLEKSKLSAPQGECLFTYDLQKGDVDNAGYLIAQGLERGLITQSGAMWDIPGVLSKAIRGKDVFRKYVDDNEEIVEWLMTEVMPQEASDSPTAPAPAKKKPVKKTSVKKM